MELRIPPKEIVPFGLRAMKTVALANGRIDQLERDLLSAAQAVLGSSSTSAFASHQPLQANMGCSIRRRFSSHCAAACKIDPTDRWDPWPIMDQALEALRTEYGIPPLPAIAGSVPV
jgi:hypothetical protein